jgi:hypothetical protein
VVFGMNDKVCLTLRNYSLSERAKENIITRSVETYKGSELVGTEHKRFINGSNFQLNILNEEIAHLQFNPNKICGSYALGNINFNSIKQAYSTVNDTLADLGIDVDLSKQEVREYHNSFDVATLNEYESYYNLLNSYKANSGKMDKLPPQGNSIYYQNPAKTRTVVVYDKYVELEHQLKEGKIDTSIFTGLPYNILRFETRYKVKKAENRFNLNSMNETKYETQRARHKQLLLHTFFYVKDISELSMVEYFVDNFEHYRNDTLLGCIGSQALHKELNELGCSIKDILPKYHSKSKEYSKKRSFEKMLKNHSIMVNIQEHTRALYYELQTKLLSA